MVKPSLEVLKALCNLEGNHDFRVVRVWLQESAAAQDDILRSSEAAPIVYRAQGAVKELLAICEIAATPRELAGKLAAEKAGVRITNP